MVPVHWPVVSFSRREHERHTRPEVRLLHGTRQRRGEAAASVFRRAADRHPAALAVLVKSILELCRDGHFAVLELRPHPVADLVQRCDDVAAELVSLGHHHVVVVAGEIPVTRNILEQFVHLELFEKYKVHIAPVDLEGHDRTPP